MKKRHGGKREGAGMKPGSKKTKLKPNEKKRTIKKSYNWTPEEYERIQDAVKVLNIKESKIVQSGTLQRVQKLLEEQPYESESEQTP